MSRHSPAKREGILLVNKPVGLTSFALVHRLRRLTGVQKIGHAGTLDPFATGVMVMLIGKSFTKQSLSFLQQDKEYVGCIELGVTTDSYDCDGEVTARSEYIPSLEEIEKSLLHFQGSVEQIPPMFSAKKVKGKKLCDLARQGVEIERAPILVTLKTTLVSYSYPYLTIRVQCSKGTYIRSIAHDLGQMLGSGGHLKQLERSKSGLFSVEQCLDGRALDDPLFDVTPFLRLTS